ncbi:CHASE domain-containing protein [Ideonella sp.]|uniref:sensor histidine kinase n=1 Tax=Ideonella sp. TaxID=1929293 RepID=UPI0035B0BB07
MASDEAPAAPGGEARASTAAPAPWLLRGWQRALGLPWLVLLAALSLTAVATGMAQRSVAAAAQAEVGAAVEQQMGHLRSRLDAYVALLRATRAFVELEGAQLDREGFHGFYERLNVFTDYPGIRGIGYTPRLDGEQVPAFEAAARAQGMTGFRVFPPGRREWMFSILYLEPPDERNLAAVGFDMFSEPTRADAMARARDTGTFALSDRVVLMQEIDRHKSAGFLVYAPMYRGAMVPVGLEARRRQLAGFVYAPFRAPDFFGSALGGNPAVRPVRVHAGGEPRADNVLHAFDGAEQTDPSDWLLRRLEFGGQVWTLSFVPRSRAAVPQAWLPQATAAAGVLISLLLWALTLAHARAGRRLGMAVQAAQAALAGEREARAALEHSNRELDQFAYVASHDLKAPLRGIANLAQWLVEDLGERASPEILEYTQLMKGRIHRMEALIDGILAYSRAGRAAGHPEPVDVAELLREVVELLAPPAGRPVEVAPGMPVLQTDRSTLQQVFLNLVGNALKHGAGPVQVGVRPEGATWHFWVRDDGPGIAPQYHERIWAMFQTLQSRDRVEGTGIGLSVVRKLVQSRGGRAWVESAEGEGATFHFTWPRQGNP